MAKLGPGTGVCQNRVAKIELGKGSLLKSLNCCNVEEESHGRLEGG